MQFLHRRQLLQGRSKVALLAVLFVALAAGTARAYRPFDLTDADVAKRHNIEVAMGPAEFKRVGSEHSLLAPNLSIAYGLATGRELTIEGGNLVALESAPDVPRMQIADVALTVKQVLRPGSLQDKPGWSVAMEPAILFPSRGELHLGAAASLLLSNASKHGTTHFNVEGERLPEAKNAGSVGMIYEAGSHFGVAPAIELKSEAVQGGPPEHSLMFGLIYVPGEEAEYDVALRFARNGDDNIFEVRAGLTWQMSAHKVLEEAGEVVGMPPPRRRRH